SRILLALTIAAARVYRHTARQDATAGRGAVPTRRRCPHIPGHVEEPVAVGGEGPGRGRSGPAVGFQVLPGERALPRVRAWLGLLEIALAPCELGAVQASSRRVFPVRLGRQ